MAFGVTPDGFVRKTFSEIVTDIETDIKNELGQEAFEAAQATGTAMNKFLVIQANQQGDLWELLESVYNNFNPATGSGVSLDNSGELTGTSRLDSTPSTVDEVLEGVVGTLIPLTSRVATTIQADEFEVLLAWTLNVTDTVKSYIKLTGAPVALTAYTVTVNVTPFTFTTAASPETEAQILDGLRILINADVPLPATATYNAISGELEILGDDNAAGLPTAYLLSVTANLNILRVGNLVEMESVEEGPIVANAGLLSVITTPVSNWTKAWNPLAAELGRDIETDAEYRIRRADSLANPGAATEDAIFAAVRAVEGVTSALVVSNRTMATVNTLPPKSFESVVLGGDDEDIAEAIWGAAPDGIEIGRGFGVSTDQEIIIDDQGFQQVIRWSRPIQVPMEVKVTYTLNSEEEFPSNGEATIAAAVLVYGQSLHVGNDVLPDRFFGPIFDSVDGVETVVVEVKEVAVGALQTTPFEITDFEISVFAADKITVTV